MKVTLLDESNQPMEGFRSSRNLHGDFLRVEVTCSGKDLSELVGQKVKLKIHGRMAKLYSY